MANLSFDNTAADGNLSNLLNWTNNDTSLPAGRVPDTSDSCVQTAGATSGSVACYQFTINQTNSGVTITAGIINFGDGNDSGLAATDSHSVLNGEVQVLDSTISPNGVTVNGDVTYTTTTPQTNDVWGAISGTLDTSLTEGLTASAASAGNVTAGSGGNLTISATVLGSVSATDSKGNNSNVDVVGDIMGSANVDNYGVITAVNVHGLSNITIGGGAGSDGVITAVELGGVCVNGTYYDPDAINAGNAPGITNLAAGNIKNNVAIAGVTGSFVGGGSGGGDQALIIL